MKMHNRTTSRISPICAALLMLAQAVIAAPSGHQVYVTQTGGREHDAILNALRKPVTKYHKNKPVVFTGVKTRVSRNGWAYVDAMSVNPGREAIGPDFTNELAALLRRKNGRWTVEKWTYASDVVSIDWEKKYPRVPKKLWPHNR